MLEEPHFEYELLGLFHWMLTQPKSENVHALAHQAKLKGSPLRTDDRSALSQGASEVCGIV